MTTRTKSTVKPRAAKAKAASRKPVSPALKRAHIAMLAGRGAVPKKLASTRGSR